MVDPKSIFFWGISLSAGIALSAASVDRRIAAVIAIAPIFKFLPVTAADSRRLKTKLIKDRESQILHGNPPYILPIAESLAQIPFNSHVNANRDSEEEARKQREEEEKQRQHERWKLEAAEDGDREYDSTLTHNPYGTTVQSYFRYVEIRRFVFCRNCSPCNPGCFYLSRCPKLWPTRSLRLRSCLSRQNWIKSHRQRNRLLFLSLYKGPSVNLSRPEKNISGYYTGPRCQCY
jgi:hypothetical protein